MICFYNDENSESKNIFRCKLFMYEIMSLEDLDKSFYHLMKSRGATDKALVAEIKIKKGPGINDMVADRNVIRQKLL